MSTLKVAYVGMTHLGINSAVASAAKGADVVCFDLNDSVIQSLKAFIPPVVEPQLAEFMVTYQERLHYSSDISDLHSIDLVIVAPDVSTDDFGNSDLALLNSLIQTVDVSLPPTIPLVVLSQIPPGFSQSLRLKSERPYYCQVETLIFGQAVERALTPERILVGCSDPAIDIHPAYSAFLALYGCPLLPMKYESAELAKIAINCCLVSSISVANTLSELCEHVGADWEEIVPALKLDKRIGQFSYLAPGLGIAGGNLERDLRTVTKFAAKYGTNSAVVEAWEQNSKYRRDWVLRLIHSKVLPCIKNPKVAVWGLAYKQDTHSVKNSPSLALIEHLDKWELSVFDPVVPASVVTRRPLESVTTPIDACIDADLLVVMTPWQDFKEHSLKEVVSKMRSKFVIDPYGVFSESPKEDDVTYYQLGKPTY